MERSFQLTIQTTVYDIETAVMRETSQTAFSTARVMRPTSIPNDCRPPHTQPRCRSRQAQSRRQCSSQKPGTCCSPIRPSRARANENWGKRARLSWPAQGTVGISRDLVGQYPIIYMSLIKCRPTLWLCDPLATNNTMIAYTSLG
jgi:hypothetical protein